MHVVLSLLILSVGMEPSTLAQSVSQAAPASASDYIAIWGAVTGTAGVFIGSIALILSFLQYRHNKQKDTPKLRIETFVDYIQSSEKHKDDMLIIGLNVYNESSFPIHLDDFISEPQKMSFPMEGVCIENTTIEPSGRQSGRLAIRFKYFPIERAYFLDTHDRHWYLSRQQLKEINAAIHDPKTRTTENGTA